MMKSSTWMGVLIVSGLGLLLNACSSADSIAPAAPSETTQAAPDVKAPAKAIDNYGVTPEKNIVLKKEALEKEHLLRAQLVDFEQPVALFNGLKTRIVSFRHQGESVYMLEATQGHKVSEDIPIDLLLATFPVLEQDDNTVTIDFDRGMHKVFATSSWSYGPSGNSVEAVHVSVDQSYIKAAEVTEDNLLYIQQTAALRDSERGMSKLAHVEARYYISPYAPDPDYQPLETEGNDSRMLRYGFFSIKETFNQEKEEKRYAARFHPNKPITFAISANTPKEYVETVKEGILYWNKAFGQDVIKVEIAPEGVSAPHPKYNIVQWLDWPGAGFARADAQMDPRTGQVLNGQVMMTSVFALSGKRAALRRKKQNEISAQGLEVLSAIDPLHREELGLPEIDSLSAAEDQLQMESFGAFSLQDSRCQHPVEAALAEASAAVKEALENGDEEVALKISQDYVRETVAHEIGHVLGLRHNFAGSLAADYPLSERDAMVAEYLQAGVAPAKITSSSVMDYQRFGEATISGAQIVGGQAKKYDYHAIQKLYRDQEFPADEKGEFLFCTDSHVGQFIDCQRFDLGRSAAEFAQYEVKKVFDDLAFTMIRRYVAAKTSEKEISEVVHRPVTMATDVMASLRPLMESFQSSAKTIRFYRQASPAELGLVESAVQAAQFDWLTAQVNELGGLAAVLDVVEEGFAPAQLERFSQILEKYAHGKSASGKEYSLSAQELEQIQLEARVVYGQLQVLLPLIKVTILGMPEGLRGDTANSSLASEFRAYLGETAAKHVLRQRASEQTPQGFIDLGTQVIHMENGHQTEVGSLRLPVYADIFPLRMAAARLLREGRAGMSWGLSERGAIYRLLHEAQKEAFAQIDMKFIDKSRLEASMLQDWALQHETLLAVLNPFDED